MTMRTRSFLPTSKVISKTLVSGKTTPSKATPPTTRSRVRKASASKKKSTDAASKAASDKTYTNQVSPQARTQEDWFNEFKARTEAAASQDLLHRLYCQFATFPTVKEPELRAAAIYINQAEQEVRKFLAASGKKTAPLFYAGYGA